MNFKNLLVLALGVSGAVIEASDKDIDTYLSNKIPTILDLHASWCGHCKEFSPVFDELAAEFEHLSDQIQFIKVDVDKNRKTSKRFAIEYIPSIRWINGDEMEELNDRDILSLKKHIKDSIGLTPDASRKPELPKVNRESKESHVQELIDDTFSDAIFGKHALVAFTAEWCQHCEKFWPHWEELARLYATDDDIVVANVDCTEGDLSYSLMETFSVDHFPTVVYIPPKFTADIVPEEYNGPRELEALVKYAQDKGISQREADGKLGKNEGVISSLDLSVLPDFEALKKQVVKSESKFKDTYERILDKAKTDSSYLVREAERLKSLIASESLTRDASEKLQIKDNIISSLLHAIHGVKNEL